MTLTHRSQKTFYLPTIAQLPNLPTVHRDPFDRILICQAIQHNLLLMTIDVNIKQYPLVQIAP